MDINFYNAPMSSAVPVARALHELEVTHNAITMKLKSPEIQAPEFLRLNPNGLVPTLTIDGAPMFEALAILIWLGDTFGTEKNLWPKPQTPEHYQALSWCTWSYVSLIGVFGRYYRASNPENNPLYHEPTAKQATQDMQVLFDVLNNHLSHQGSMLGSSYSLVDLVVGSVVDFASLFGADIANHQHINQWLSQIRARDCFKKYQ